MAEKISFPSAFYIDKQQLSFVSAKQGEVLTLPLSNEVVQDLGIISESGLERVVGHWVDQSKITPGQTLLILSDQITFSADINEVTAKASDPEVENFTTMLPFERVIHKVFPLENKARVTAVNASLLLPLKSVLEKLGFSVICISPSFAVGFDEKTEFSKEIGKSAMEMADVLFKFNLLSDDEVTSKLHAPEAFLSVKIDKKVIGMISVFVILLVVLGMMVWLQNR
jgi:hypothetical protein